MSVDTIRCDGIFCDTKQRVSRGAHRPPRGWIYVRWGRKRLHFCRWDCAMGYGATHGFSERVA